MIEQRDKLVTYVKNQLTGSDLSEEPIKVRPLDRFVTGCVFPIHEDEDTNQLEQDVPHVEFTDENSEREAKTVKKVRRYIPPSSAGFSFYITGTNIKLRVFYSAVSYIKNERIRDDEGRFVKQEWEKSKLVGDGGEEVILTYNQRTQGVFEFEYNDNGIKKQGYKAKIDSHWREHGDGYIVTISIVNNQKIPSEIERNKYRECQNSLTLFEVELKCIIESGEINIYPTKERGLMNDEEKEIEVRYKDVHAYAVGHGCAVNWGYSADQDFEIWLDFIPTVEVPQVTANTGKANQTVLAFAHLQTIDSNSGILEELGSFVEAYASWIQEQADLAERAENEDREISKRIVEKQKIAKLRMMQAIDLLSINENARVAFAKANEAMLMQWISSDQNRGLSKDQYEYRWRPFQLAFILVSLESTVNENSEYRDTLDLIWFPTGGGKTEAYLGLIAFLFIYRRLAFPTSHGGTVAIMRYTLRLLSSQQFLRANKIIFALELIRRRDESLYGVEPFTVGFWVGRATSPNTTKQAQEVIHNEQFSKLVLYSCPWCDSKFNEKNYRIVGQEFYFSCTNQKCDFGVHPNNRLPCNVVDESLYRHPPSLLIGTVDKFARLAWEERAGSFFGKNGSSPPELIIQDELHLISGALGSIVGLYEIAIDVAILSRGRYAKYIASTATIKNASQQVRTLFGREMAIFPPSGLRHDDSFFAKTVPLNEKSGRLYIGYLKPDPYIQRSIVPLAGSLLAAPTKLFKDDEQYLDNWWTQVIYHSSLKGLGESRTLYQSNIPQVLTEQTIQNLKDDLEAELKGFTKSMDLESISGFRKISQPELKKIVDQYIPVRSLEIKSLSSQNSAEENAQIFSNLEKERLENGALDVTLATNMVSVGLDVSRLAVMIIKGQPLTTSEYIQASSRVGRGSTPGVVFANYYYTQARSSSHYENFRSYHETFYRYVEPSSLTPFTYQARTRALHAVLGNSRSSWKSWSKRQFSAGDFDPDSDQ